MKKSRAVQRIQELRELHVLRALQQQRERAPPVNAAILRILKLRARHVRKALEKREARQLVAMKPIACTLEVRSTDGMKPCGLEALPQFNEQKDYTHHECSRGHPSYSARPLNERGWVTSESGRSMVPERRTERADVRAFPSQGRSTGIPYIPDAQVTRAAELQQGIQTLLENTSRSGYSQVQDWIRVREQQGLIQPK